jgi:tripartite-type tricarboxylate transporter receptor subunit TctC
MRMLLISVLLVASSALAQGDYPSRPLRLLVTVPPGGAADFIARLSARSLPTRSGRAW